MRELPTGSTWEARFLQPFQYYLLCTISFSTVMPAVFETAELVRTFQWVERRGTGPAVSDSRAVIYGLFATGIAMMALTLLWPKYCYPFVWTSLALILEPTQSSLGHPSFLSYFVAEIGAR
jgi:hypothetical protein